MVCIVQNRRAAPQEAPVKFYRPVPASSIKRLPKFGGLTAELIRPAARWIAPGRFRADYVSGAALVSQPAAREP